MEETQHKGILYNEVIKLTRTHPRIHRVLSMLLDHIILTMITVLPSIILMIFIPKSSIIINDHTYNIIFFLILFIYLNKDFYKAKSPAKRLLGYQVIHLKSKKPATEVQCFIRNLTICIAWPIEVVMGLINPERRIGDYIANTKVVIAEKETITTIWTDLKHTKLKLNFAWIIIIGMIYFYLLYLLMPTMI
ncbi:RDD family protein [Aquimarina rhabdastrellae]